MEDQELPFKFFPSSKSAEEVIELHGPLVGKWEEDPEIWEKIDWRMKKFMWQENKQIASDTQLEYIEDWESIVEGAVHLINFVLERERTGQPVSGLLFLDKSARPGAYLVRKIWNELQRAQTIQQDMPPILFMNIGKGDEHKHNRPRTNALVRKAFSDTLSNGVVVVDEYIDSGITARYALHTLESLYKIEAVAISQNRYLPEWYGWEGITGVDDEPLSVAVYKAMEELDDEDFEALSQLVKKYREAKEFRIVWHINTNEGKGFGDLIRGAISSEKKLSEREAQILKNLKRNRIDSLSVYRYFHTFGGFLSSFDPKNRPTLKKHRDILVHLAQEVAPFISSAEESL